MRMPRKLRFTIPPLLLLAATAAAFQGHSEEVLAEGEILSRNSAMAGQDVSVDGVVQGDLMAAGRQVTIGGEIEDDLWAAGQFVSIPGKVGDDVRVAAQRLRINGQVGSELLAFAERVELGHDAFVGGEVQAAADTVIIQGRIMSLDVECETLVIDGEVAGDVKAKATHIELRPGASIGGDLSYTSSIEATIDARAVVAGEIRHKKPPPRPTQVHEEDGSDWSLGEFPLFRLLAAILTGLALIAFGPGLVDGGAAQLRRASLRSFLVGFVAFAAGPLAMLILLITVIGIPLSLLVMFLYLTLLYLGSIPVAVLLGRLLLKLIRRPDWGRRAYLPFILGTLVMCFIAMLPGIGGWIKFLWILFGTGALVSALFQSYRSARSPQPVTIEP